MSHFQLTQLTAWGVNISPSAEPERWGDFHCISPIVPDKKIIFFFILKIPAVTATRLSFMLTGRRALAPLGPCSFLRETKEPAKQSVRWAQSLRSDQSSDCRLSRALPISCSCRHNFNEATADTLFGTTMRTCNGLFSQCHGQIVHHDSKPLHRSVVLEASSVCTRSLKGSS